MSCWDFLPFWKDDLSGNVFLDFVACRGATVLSLDCPLDDIVSCVDTVGFIGLLALDSLREAA